MRLPPAGRESTESKDSSAVGGRDGEGGGGRWESERENDGKVRERGRKIAGRVGIDAVY